MDYHQYDDEADFSDVKEEMIGSGPPGTKAWSVSCNGWATASDGFAASSNTRRPYLPMELWLLSLVGPQTTTRAVRANILKGETARITPLSSEGYTLEEYGIYVKKADDATKWAYEEARLPQTKALHSIVYSKAVEPENDSPRFLTLSPLFTGKGKLDSGEDWEALEAGEEEKQCLRGMNPRTRLPLHPQWGNWLKETLKKQHQAKELICGGMKGYIYSVNEAILKRSISDAIASGNLKVEDEKSP